MNHGCRIFSFSFRCSLQCRVSPSEQEDTIRRQSICRVDHNLCSCLCLQHRHVFYDMPERHHTGNFKTEYLQYPHGFRRCGNRGRLFDDVSKWVGSQQGFACCQYPSGGCFGVYWILVSERRGDGEKDDWHCTMYWRSHVCEFRIIL